jgi:UDP:flavonoid glycosyltransferase YjiC (YdhE family)
MFSVGIQNVNEYILAPAEFDFASICKGKDQIYIGFQIDLCRRIHNNNLEYDLIKKYVIEDKRTKGTKVVYCSFGTFGLADAERVKVISFINKLVAFAENNADYFLFIAVSKKVLQQFQFNSCPNNIFVGGFLPQLDVLSFSDLFISHGGLNSIKEAIQFKIPLLLYPFDKYFDSFGNVSKINYFKLGIPGSMERDSAMKVENKIKRAIKNKVTFEANIQRLKDINTSYDSAKFSQRLMTMNTLC